jgi:hypothetical protein
MPEKMFLAVCSSIRCAGWAVRRIDSLVLSEAPGVVLCSCTQGGCGRSRCYGASFEQELEPFVSLGTVPGTYYIVRSVATVL